MSRYGCLWIPDFAAWAAQQSEPKLQGKPVLVHQGRHIVAASTEARLAGAETGWTLHRAQAQLPDAVYWPLHGPTVNAVWSETIAALLEFTPYIESLKPGLLLMDVRPPGRVLLLVRQWQAQCGVADDRATAELAAFTAAPGTMRVVRSGQSAAFLRRVPLSILTCAGLRTDSLQRLAWFGWQNVGDLAHLTKRQLTAQFDQAPLLFRYAQAADTRPLSFYRQSPVISTYFNFETPVREPYEWLPVLRLLIEQAHAALQGQGAQTIGVQVATDSGMQRGYRMLPCLTTESRPFNEVAQHILTGMMRTSAPMLSLRVQLGALRALPPTQTRLFGRERPSIGVAVRAVEERFPGALCRIVMLDKNAYLPEAAFRLEPITIGNADHSVSSRCAPRTTQPKTDRTKRRKQVPSTLKLAL